MNEKQARQGLTAVINEDLKEIMRVFMLGTNGGDETPTQAVKWDHHVDELAGLMIEIKSQNL